MHREVGLSYGPRRTWLALTAGIAALGALEVVAGHLILSRLLGPPWSTGLDLVLAASAVVLTVLLASPLGARPRLTDDHLVLGFGALGRARLPVAAIASMEPFEPAAGAPVPLGVGVEGDPPVATFSLGRPAGYLRLLTHEPVTVRHSLWRRSQAADLRVGLADPDPVEAWWRRSTAGPPSG